MEKRQAITVLALVALMTFGSDLIAQGGQSSKDNERSTFGLSLIGGANFSQIDGDNFKGYDYVGIYAGLRGIMRFSDAFEAHVELLYSQKGSRFESREGAGNGEKDRYIKLDYAEVPIMLSYRLTPEYSSTQFWVEGGVSIGRLLKSDVKDADNPSEKEFLFEEIEDQFNKNDINLLAGVGFNPTPWLGFGFRGSWGVKKFYKEDPNAPPQPGDIEKVPFLRNYSLSLFAMYHF